MQTPVTFVNWLEGFLDGCGNTPTQKQMKEIRKRLSEISQNHVMVPNNQMVPMWETNPLTIALEQPLSPNFGKNEQVNEEFLQAIEESKNASTMEELFS
jgi:hypothetical protein